MKNYILTKDTIKDLAAAVAYQDGELHLEKRQGTNFYIAITGDDVTVPANHNIFEIDGSDKQTKFINKLSDDNSFVDLTLRFKLTDDIDANFINEKVAPAIHRSVEKVLKDKYKDNLDDI